MGDYKPQPWETRYEDDVYIEMYPSLFRSEAWIDIGAMAHSLYMACRMEYAENEVKRTSGESKGYFAMPRCKWYGKYKLTKNPRSFKRAMEELIEHGFVELSMSKEQSNTADLYQFSGKWKWWTERYGLSHAEEMEENARKGWA